MGRHGSTPYPKELRDQAVRFVREWRAEHGRRDGVIREVAVQLSVHVESVRNWVRQSSNRATPRGRMTVLRKPSTARAINKGPNVCLPVPIAVRPKKDSIPHAAVVIVIVGQSRDLI